jgi:RNA polymerase sigma-70 factor, ECF subfamily
MRLLRSEQAPVSGQYPDARVENPDGGPSAGRVDPRAAAQPTAQIGRRGPAEPAGPGYNVPVLPRQRPDEVPAPPLPEHAGAPHGNTDPRAAAPGVRPAPARVAEPRPAPSAPQAAAGGDDGSSESSGDEVTDGNGPAGWDLVRATQAGDQQAFGQLYDRYHDMVFRYVLFRIGDRQLAEDLTAETFLRALRRIGSVSYQGRDIGAWFVTIARNLVLDHVKSSRYRLEQTTSEIADLSPATSGPEQQVLDGATHEELLRCVAKLNADQKECIALRFLQGLSVAETARLMGRNEGAVKALQHRAVRRLAQLLPEGLR